ncbi:cysteine--tRNA ligase [Candidatus Pacearchaeota archaeon]|nr:hypothetical protein [uncultured archaeon]MBS3085127.1 cysteine--tRNA ligase [Candidatus Pacearchaeota archaeon]
MALKLYNTLTRKKEVFKPLKSKNVNIFVCGPTVYDYAHIGHGKTYVAFDVIVKYLRYKGYRVFYLQNITDLDDKIIIRAKEEKTTPDALAKKYEKLYYEDISLLGVNSVTKSAPATNYIKEIINQVSRLLKKGYGYEIKGDGIYYDLSKFKEYGKLSRRKVLEAEDAVSRIDNSINKRNKGDFCLWKFSKPEEPSWESPFGEGRPGWHIEDTAITEKYFGQQYDIHGGARDLIFPHHEAEIAQMEVLSGKQLVKYWMHTGFLNVEGQKMSKSLGNFISIKDAMEKYDKYVLRLLYLSAHYRSPINFSEKMLKQAKNASERLKEFMRKIKNNREKDDIKLIKKTKESFIKAMDDDFDTVKALSVIFNFVRKVNKKGGSKKSYGLMKEFDEVLGILPDEETSVPDKIKNLTAEREKLRKQKKWQEADKIREEIKNLGYALDDTSKGTVVKKI